MSNDTECDSILLCLLAKLPSALSPHVKSDMQTKDYMILIVAIALIVIVIITVIIICCRRMRHTADEHNLLKATVTESILSSETATRNGIN